MKYLKTFESVNKLQNGDYVYCVENIEYRGDIGEFISNNIGLLIRNDSGVYYVRYENIPIDLKDNFTYLSDDCGIKNMLKNEIKFWSKNRKDVEEYLKEYLLKVKEKKYNL